MMGIDFHNGGTVMTNWGYKAVRKVLQTFGGAELAQQQSGRITGEILAKEATQEQILTMATSFENKKISAAEGEGK